MVVSRACIIMQHVAAMNSVNCQHHIILPTSLPLEQLYVTCKYCSSKGMGKTLLPNCGFATSAYNYTVQTLQIIL